MPKRNREERDQEQEPEILTAVRMSDGQVYYPGDEDLLRDALVVELGEDAEDEDVDNELRRLTRKGHIVGFGFDDEEEELADERAKNIKAQVQDVVRKKARKARKPKQEEEETEDEE